MAQYWMNRKNFEDAQECLHRIDTTRWSDVAYRTTIRCLLMSKPRQLHEAESTLSQWINSLDDSQPSEIKCREWFQLQLDASKWEDVKALYERKRSRLLDAPSNLDRVADAESRLTPQALQDHQQQEQSMSPPRNNKHQRSVSITSSTTTSSHRRSPTNQLSSISGHQRSPSGHQRTPSTAMAWPSGASASIASPTPAASAPAATKGTFSFLSSFKFGAKSNETGSSSSGTNTPLPSRLNVNRHLTVLDNSMLEDCITHKQFEYGWTNIYERMGSTLEDGDTARIAMRLCRRAFLGHSGLSFDQPGSPNLVAKDTYFDSTDSSGTDGSGPKDSGSDPALWEGRAWVIYNKAMLNPHAFLSKSTGVPSHHPLVLPGNVAGAGSSPMAMFWHDILTISIHSPEVSSRYLKSFKIYVAMRSDPVHHQQLRDPFVMSCMLKAVYDAALAIVHNADHPPSPIPVDQSAEALKRHRRTSSLSLNRKQPITLGPIIDLAIEIYADLRQVGPIRHLPSLLTLAPTSPAGVSQAGSEASPRVSSVELSKAPSSEVPRKSSVSVSTRSSLSELGMPVFQDLNSTLKPNAQAKNLPPHIYLALLHLSIQVPVFRLSSLVVRTIVSDLQSEAGVNATRQDPHLAAALQSYHDTWMCAQLVATETKTSDASAQSTPCAYFEWMYQPLDLNDTSLNGGVNDHADVVKEGPLEPSLQSPSTCNENLYWDLWSSSDPALQELRFMPERAAKLWDHVAQALL